MMIHATTPSPSAPPPVGPEQPTPERVVRLEGSAKQALETGRTRLLVTGLVFALGFLVVGLRLVDVTVFMQGQEPRLASQPAAVELETGRADIVDRNGIVLATTLPTASLYANPRHVVEPDQVARQLHAILPELSEGALRSKLAVESSFVWLKRNLTPREHHRINRLGIPGLYFQREDLRVFPHGALTAHAVGFTDVDNKGLAGMEQAFDDVLRGSSRPLELSLDLRAQHIMAEELAAAMTTFKAIGAAGMVLDVTNGEVIAMVSLPTFDPTAPAEAPDDARFNRNSLGVYEMGSVFKIFTTAMALETGTVGLNDGYDVSKPIRVSRFTINDFKPKKRWLSVPEIFIYSSNIGTVHMAMEAGTAAQQDFLGKLGLTRTASFELPEIGRPMVPSPWRKINTMTISYGHGLAVSPLQLVSAVGAVVNGGELLPATLLRRVDGERAIGRRVMSERTSQEMRWLMRMVVRNGTGRKANAEGYLVGGKTGTADKLVGRRYSNNARVASFISAFPMDRPRYVIFAMVDEPKGNKSTYGYATGGWVAAPVVRRVVERMGPLFGIRPRVEEETAGLDQLLMPASAEGFVLAAH
jgi:cell division protein FtsI (penicillin-binding protein 3)